MAPSTKLFVGNLPDTLRPKELQSVFERHGNVVECDIIRDYAFVHFKIESEAQAAVKALDGYEIKGVKIRVEISKSSVRQKPGMGEKNNCFRCGDPGHWSRDCPKNPESRVSESVAERLQGRREREAARARQRSPPRDPYYDAYYRDYYRDYPYPPAYRYRPYDYPPRRAYAPPVREYDPDPYTRPPPEYYASRGPLYRREQASPYARELASPYDREPASPYAREQASPYAREQASPYAREQASPYASRSQLPLPRVMEHDRSAPSVSGSSLY